MTPLISIIVPIYNREKFLNQCISSIINQTYKKLEIILVDDGSSDSSLEICKKYAATDDRVKVISQENGGVSKARNKGLEVATGEYIQFVDSDDFLDVETLDYYVNLLDKDSKLDLVICGFKNLDKNLKLIKFEKTDFEITCKTDFLNNFHYLLERNLLRSPVNKLYKSNIIKENNLQFRLDAAIAEDALFNLEYYQYIENIVVTTNAFYNVVDHSDSRLTTSYHPNLFEIQKSYFSKLQEYLQKNSVYSGQNKVVVEKQYFSIISKEIRKIVLSDTISIIDELKKNQEFFLNNFILESSKENNKLYVYIICKLYQQMNYFKLLKYIFNPNHIRYYRAKENKLFLKSIICYCLYVVYKPIAFLKANKIWKAK